MSAEVRAPKVSVCVITYNQEAFIGPCLQSIIEQQTDFDFEIIVGEDLSTDQTRAVVYSFAERYPKLIRPIYQEQNIGRGAHNFRTVHLAARGQYGAHVDGDDLVLPGKLQAQVDLLDARPDVAFAAHAVQLIGSEELIGADANFPEYGTVYDLLRLGTYFVHSSVMYRRRAGGVESFPEICVDYYMHVERAVQGLVYLDKRTLGCYRSHRGSLSQRPDIRHSLEGFYEAAFDRALALGLDASAVQAARLDRRMKFAIARCLAGDHVGYRQSIRLTAADWQVAGYRHRVLHSTRWTTLVVRLYFFMKALKKRRLAQGGI